MANQTFHLPPARSELALGVLLGAAFAAALFLVMALAQMLGDVKVPEQQIDETLIAYVPPEVVEIEEEPPPPEVEEEEPPELEEAPPQLSLDQLDIALNPGTGASLMGDFAMPTINTSASSLGTEDFVDFSDLDQKPQPVGVNLRFPRRLLKKKVNGTIVLLIKLDETGDVLEAELASSNLPDFNDFVLNEVSDWRFTPPTVQGRPVKAQARFPIPININ